MHLISFLGRVPKNQGKYRTTQYQFENGDETEPVSFIGWSLIERIKPEHIVILGTKGSMWDHLLETINNNILEKIDETLYMELLDQVDKKNVTQQLLDQLAPYFESYLKKSCDLVIIPYGKTAPEQIEIMEVIEQYIPEKSEVSIDITHGFRHLPMLGLISAQYLRRIKNVDIHSIYYGMFDPDLGMGEVYNLKGLLQLDDWVYALAQFDKDGDYSVFAKPLEQDQFSKTGIASLKKAAYYERTFNVSQARQCLNTFKQKLGDKLPAAGQLFSKSLKKRIEWSNSDNLLTHQRHLAHFYLNNGDPVRAAIFGLEAFITSLLDDTENQYDYDDRKTAIDEFKAQKRGDRKQNSAFKDLNNIRNAMAHGSKAANKKYRTILNEPEKLDTKLHQLFKELKI